MDKEIKKMLQQIMANQVALYKRLEEIEIKIKGGMRSAPNESYVKDLKKESDKYLPFICIFRTKFTSIPLESLPVAVRFYNIKDV